MERLAEAERSADAAIQLITSIRNISRSAQRGTAWHALPCSSRCRTNPSLG
jgi:hypothetical protein